VQNKAFAATLSNVSNTISTSRPSASTPLSANSAAAAGSVSVYNNGSIFLASDSATLWGQTPETITVSTVSANKQTVFFASNTSNAHTNGTVASTPITAVHTVKFSTITSIPTGGSIRIIFPTSASSDTNQSSPSASTFMLNDINTSNIKLNISSGTTTCTFSTTGTGAGSAPAINCNTANADLAGGTTVTILVGCASAGTSCAATNQRPALINPTKTAAQGTADTWNIQIKTYSEADGGGTILDAATARIGTVESVNVMAHIDPTLTFTIAGIANNTDLSGAAYCESGHAADTTNSGFGTTPSEINLGTLVSTQINRAAQALTITSNAGGGYTITATSSGHFINPATGYWIPDAQGTPTANDTPAPAVMASGTPGFGIHACDANSKVTKSTWCNSGDSTCDTTATDVNFANPSQSFYYTLVNSAVMPASGGDKIIVEYAAAVASTTPPGDYRTTLTYVATPIF